MEKLITNLEDISLDEMVSGVLEELDSERFDLGFIQCINPHSFSVALKDEDFKESFYKAKRILVDGVGIALYSKFILCKKLTRITGYDFFFSLSKELNKVDKKYKIFFLGSTTEVLAKIFDKYSLEFSNLDVCGTYSPPIYNELEEVNWTECLNLIEESKPDILWVGLTAPKQEKWMNHFHKISNSRVMVGIGAVFDFYSGNKPQSPKFISKLGLEWLFRFISEPRRLWRRVFISNPIFLYRMLRYKFMDYLKKGGD